MSKASPNGALIITMACMAVVLCGALALTMEYAKTEFKVKEGEEQKRPAAAPEGPYAARIKELSRREYAVTQHGEDERESFGRYVSTSEPGLYVDVVSADVLFSSLDKLEPLIGYAEFSKPFDFAGLVEQEATVTGETRLQVRSKTANSYLGWIVKDEPGGARRYVINSSALRFVPATELDKNGLGRHRALFPHIAPAPAPSGGTEIR